MLKGSGYEVLRVGWLPGGETLGVVGMLISLNGLCYFFLPKTQLEWLRYWNCLPENQTGTGNGRL